MRRLVWGLLAVAIALAVACNDGKSGDAEIADVSGDVGAADVIVDGSGADDPDALDPDAAEVDVIEPDDRGDGAPCVSDIQCASGTCLGPVDGFPDGLCSVMGCESRRDCFGVGTACLRGEFNGNLCVELCTADIECRPGYQCRGAGNGAYCFPGFAGDALDPTCASEQLAAGVVPSPFVFSGGGSMNRHEISFDVSDDATAFTLVAWDLRRRLFPERIHFPDGTTLEMEEYAGYLFSPVTFETVSPVLYPAGPQFIPAMGAGRYTAEFGYDGEEADDVCFVVLEETVGLTPEDEPLIVDLNFYFVGTPGLNSNTASDDADFQEMLSQFDDAYAQAGVQLGSIRYLDVLGDVADRYEIIHSQEEVFELVTLSRQPGPDRDDLLSANVFFNRGFGGAMSGVLGVSAGIPGAPGIHGSPGTGLVFSAGPLGNSRNNRMVGQTMAHELGHFVGLFHTTERMGGGTDQLDDTPICEEISDAMADCPDLSNLMFPVAAWDGLAEISTGQASIIRANPLTKPEAEP